MTDQSTDSERAVPLALAEPSVHVRSGWIAGLSLASLGMWMASLTPIQVLLPIQLQNIDKAHKIAALAIVSGVGAVASVVATPLAGALSDRTSYAYSFFGLNGRRHRWTLIMALLGAVSMLLLAHQQTVAGVAVFWVIFSAFQNGEYASLSAAIPDHVPVRQRATVAGWVGMPQALGLVVGTVLVVLVLGSRVVSGYYVMAALFFLLVIPFVFLTPDHPLDPEHVDSFSWKKLIQAYWISPKEYPDFAWAWITRFLASLAIAMGTLYLLYFLRDQVKLYKAEHIPAATGLLILIVIYTVCVVLTAIVGGIISDRIGKRKMIVTVSGALMGLAALLLTFVETWDASLVAAVLFGMGFGAYLAVDQALITQVLPAAADRAKDLGIINIAIVGPAAIGAAIAGPLVILGGYPTLFAGTAIVAALGSIFVWKIKSVP
jgi:MFS family permease